MNKDWSDDEDNEDNDNNELILIQPSRDFPISNEENENEEEYEYDMYELTKLTMNNTSDDLFNTNLVKNKKDFNEHKIENKKEKVINSILDKIVKKINVRKFNPRLPPPNKYKKNYKNNFNLDIKDFPSL
jgi:hypothetical protein